LFASVSFTLSSGVSHQTCKAEHKPKTETVELWNIQGSSWDQGASDSASLCSHPQLLEDLEEQLNCSAFEEAALTRRICSELDSLPLSW
jgi:hypothetical protein